MRGWTLDPEMSSKRHHGNLGRETVLGPEANTALWERKLV